MSTLSYQPLRQSVQLAQLSDEEIGWKLADKKRAGDYFSSISESRYKTLYARLGKTGQTRLIPDAEGRIEVILLTLPPYYDQKNPDVPVDPSHGKHLLALLRHLSRHNRNYIIHCHASQVKTVKRWFRKLGIAKAHYRLSVSVFNYSIWAQDAYVSLRNSAGNMILGESVCFIRDHDMSVADDLAIQTKVKVLQSHLYFQGGNIIQAGGYAIIGMDYIMENLGRMFMETTQKVEHEFSQLFGCPVITLGRNNIIPSEHRRLLGGGIFQPVFHIDMYVSPTGVKDKTGKELLFVGSPRLARKILGEKKEEKDFDIYFDEAAKQLSRYFRIKRLPLLPTRYQSKHMDSARQYFLTYNNSLVESYGTADKPSRHVYMPCYAHSTKEFINDWYITQYYGSEDRYKKLDDAAARIWEKAGFKVYRIEGVEDLAMGWGSVHCITKALKRSEEPVS